MINISNKLSLFKIDSRLQIKSSTFQQRIFNYHYIDHCVDIQYSNDDFQDDDDDEDDDDDVATGFLSTKPFCVQFYNILFFLKSVGNYFLKYD